MTGLKSSCVSPILRARNINKLHPCEKCKTFNGRETRIACFIRLQKKINSGSCFNIFRDLEFTKICAHCNQKSKYVILASILGMGRHLPCQAPLLPLWGQISTLWWSLTRTAPVPGKLTTFYMFAHHNGTVVVKHGVLQQLCRFIKGV